MHKHCIDTTELCIVIVNQVNNIKTLRHMKNRTREVLKSLKIKQSDVAKELGITKIAMSQLLRKPQPKIATLEAVAKVIGVPTWKLFLSDEEIDEIVLTNSVNCVVLQENPISPSCYYEPIFV